MFVLTEQDYENQYVRAVFTSEKKAKKYVSKVMNQKHLKWSGPNRRGAIWADTEVGTLYIIPADLNPKP